MFAGIHGVPHLVGDRYQLWYNIYLQFYLFQFYLFQFYLFQFYLVQFYLFQFYLRGTSTLKSILCIISIMELKFRALYIVCF